MALPKTTMLLAAAVVATVIFAALPAGDDEFAGHWRADRRAKAAYLN